MSHGLTAPDFELTAGSARPLTPEGREAGDRRRQGVGAEAGGPAAGEGPTPADSRDWAEALRRSEQDARQLADTMPHIVWTATGEGAVDYFNGRWYEYTGQSPEEPLSPMAWRSAVHPDDLGRLLELRDPAVEGGQGFQADLRIRDRDGRYRWHMVRSVPVRDDSGRVLRRFGTATDIDDRRRAEEASRASEQRFRFLAESIPHLVWTCRPDGVVDYVSHRLREYLGIRPEDPLFPAWPEAVHPEDRTRANEAWETFPARGDRVPRRVPPARRPTGSIGGSWGTPCRSATTPAGWWAGTAPAPTSIRNGGAARRSSGSTATSRRGSTSSRRSSRPCRSPSSSPRMIGAPGSAPTRRWSG